METRVLPRRCPSPAPHAAGSLPPGQRWSLAQRGDTHPSILPELQAGSGRRPPGTAAPAEVATSGF